MTPAEPPPVEPPPPAEPLAESDDEVTRRLDEVHANVDSAVPEDLADAQRRAVREDG